MNLAKRILNRLGRPLRIRPFPYAADLALENVDPETVFERINAENYWGSDESVSGGGSTIERTRDYAERLTALIREFGFSSMFDAPCGDLNWMPRVIAATGIRYIGGDVSPHAIELARARLPGADLRQFDIRRDRFPAADVWHCRDCLFHLSFADGLQALRNFAASGIEHALITTNSGLWLRNIDIVSGGQRDTDLQRPPYNLPRPLRKLRDFPAGKEWPRFVGLWRRDAIARAVLG